MEPTPLTLASRCGSVGPLLRPGECTTTPDPSGEYDETRGCRPQNVTDIFTETPFPALCEEQVHHDVDDYSCDDDHEPTKLTMKQRRADSDGLCQQTEKQQRGLWADEQTSHDKSDTSSPMTRPVNQPSQEGFKLKRGEIGLTPKDAAPRPTLTRSKTFGRIFDQLQHAPPTPHGWDGGRGEGGGRGRGEEGAEPLPWPFGPHVAGYQIKDDVADTTVYQSGLKHGGILLPNKTESGWTVFLRVSVSGRVR